MHRYIAFAWNHQLTERASVAKTLARCLKSMLPDWKCALDSEGLQVYHARERARSYRTYLLDQKAGVVLGNVFKRRIDVDCDPHEVSFNKHETQQVRETKGRHLIEHYWGRYVALLREDGGTRVWIVRDPTGAIPCLLTKFRGIDVVCSHIGDIAALGFVDCAINWDHIAAYLLHYRIVTKDTGLVGVRQLHAGECITLGTDSTTTTFHWNPAHIHDARTVEDRQQAMCELRNVIQYSVGTWASCYNNILHSLSGGLDSAVVLACLSTASSGANIICENRFTSDARGDERDFAQIAAIRAKVKLVETHLSTSARPFLTMFDPTKCAAPELTQMVPDSTVKTEELIKEHGIEAVFSGQGGDHLFQQIRTPLIAADYAWHHGLRPEILNAIADTSRFTRKPIWSVVMAVLSSGFLHRHGDPYKHPWRPSPLVSQATRDAFDHSSIRHPWVDDAKHLPGNKIRQIVTIIDTQNFYHNPARCADIVHPLISQPIIELCLQIPSYVLTYGGIDRALVRDAFAGMIPSEIARRTNKSGTTSVFIEQLVENLPSLRDFLLDGHLVGKGVLDRGATEARLTESEIIRDPYLLFPVITSIYAEYWLRTWLSEDQRAAA